MGLDPNIILGAQSPQIADPMTTMTKAIGMRQAMLQNQQSEREAADQEAMRNAYKNNMTTDASGKPTLNTQGVMSDMMKTNPKMAMEFQKTMETQKLEGFKRNLDTQKTLAFSVKDDGSNWPEIRQKTIDMGLISADKLPENYDPKWLDTTRKALLSADEQYKQLDSDRNFKVSQQKADAETSNANAKLTEIELQRRKMFGDSGGKPLKTDGVNDPAVLVPHAVPEHQQTKVYDEIRTAQDTAKLTPQILQAFDNAANKLHAADFAPGLDNADQKALHALMGPTFKDVEGTVRQAAMDNMAKNTTPQFGDSAETLATKRAALMGYLQSKSSAPTAKAYGLDLSKFKTTSIQDPSSRKFDSDVIAYAQKHNISPSSAQEIKDQRTGAGQTAGN